MDRFCKRDAKGLQVSVWGFGFRASGGFEGFMATTVDDINPALPIEKNRMYIDSHSLGSFR